MRSMAGEGLAQRLLRRRHPLSNPSPVKEGLTIQYPDVAAFNAVARLPRGARISNLIVLAALVVGAFVLDAFAGDPLVIDSGRCITHTLGLPVQM
jgi:hypothetical protein